MPVFFEDVRKILNSRPGLHHGSHARSNCHAKSKWSHHHHYDRVFCRSLAHMHGRAASARSLVSTREDLSGWNCLSPACHCCSHNPISPWPSSLSVKSGHQEPLHPIHPCLLEKGETARVSQSSTGSGAFTAYPHARSYLWAEFHGAE